MYMSYSNNPNLPRVRMEAVKLVRSGWSTVKAARYLGYSQSAVVKWLARALDDRRMRVIPTRSSRPLFHPHALSEELVRAVLEYRQERNQCAEILHHRMISDGHVISLSSVKRILKRNQLTRFSKWKKWHQYENRPTAEKPGILMEIDTIHCGKPEERLYVYTMLDVCSRWAYAIPSIKISANRSVRFVEAAKEVSPFRFQTIQSDHGSEFSKWFTKNLDLDNLIHRHSRIRTPNDNAHLERFNRTIQEECLRRIPRSFSIWRKEIPEYLRYYNEERPHMGLNMKTPMDIIKSIPSY